MVGNTYHEGASISGAQRVCIHGSTIWIWSSGACTLNPPLPPQPQTPNHRKGPKGSSEACQVASKRDTNPWAGKIVQRWTLISPGCYDCAPPPSCVHGCVVVCSNLHLGCALHQRPQSPLHTGAACDRDCLSLKSLHNKCAWGWLCTEAVLVAPFP